MSESNNILNKLDSIALEISKDIPHIRKYLLEVYTLGAMNERNRIINIINEKH